MRRWIGWGTVVVLVVAGILFGVAAYHAGEHHGISEGIQQAGRGTQVVRVVDEGRGFFPFGLLLFPLLFFGLFALARFAFWRGRCPAGAAWPAWGGRCRTSSSGSSTPRPAPRSASAASARSRSAGPP